MQNKKVKCISQPAWRNVMNVLCWNVLPFQVSGRNCTVILTLPVLKFAITLFMLYINK